jgi:hypothetical protein
MLNTYRVVISLRARNIKQVQQAIEHAFGSTCAMFAQISPIASDPKQDPPPRETTARKDENT